MANGLKLIEDMDRRSRRLVLYGAYLAVCIGAFGSCWMVLNMAYRHGGINLVGWFFKGGPAVVYDTAVRNLEPAGIAWSELSSQPSRRLNSSTCFIVKSEEFKSDSMTTKLA